MKKCTSCGAEKPPEEFHRCAKNADGLAYVCKPCRKEVDAGKYAKRTPAQRRVYSDNMASRISHVASMVREYLLAHPCVDCGEADIVVLEFDHVRGEKRSNIAAAMYHWTWDTLQKEIEKCEVRCANCHRRATAKRYGWTRKLVADEALLSEALLGKKEEAGAHPAIGTIYAEEALPGDALAL